MSIYERISVVKVVGFVASRPDFYAQASVINGASELFGEVFGSAHARSAVGVAALPLNVSVEVEAEFALVEDRGLPPWSPSDPRRPSRGSTAAPVVRICCKEAYSAGVWSHLWETIS